MVTRLPLQLNSGFVIQNAKCNCKYMPSCGWAKGKDRIPWLVDGKQSHGFRLFSFMLVSLVECATKLQNKDFSGWVIESSVA